MLMVAILLLGVIGTFSNVYGVTSWSPCPNDCSGGYPISGFNISLSPLKGMWQTVSYHSTDLSNVDTIPRFFNFSICSRLTGHHCNGDHICYSDDLNSFYPLGAHSTCRFKVENRILSLAYDYGSSATSEFGTGNVTITLVCGTTLGVPEVIEGDPHTGSVEILWLTSAVCKPGSHLLVENETKCYLVNHNNNNGLQATFVDLSGLIQKSGYVATTTSYPNLILNVSVCRPMSTNGPCDGSMVCMYHNDSKLTLPGGWNSPVPIATLQKSSLTQATPHYESGDIVVTYPITAPGITSSYCDNTSPFVKIRFKCPTGDEPLGPRIEFLDPKLCGITFLWYTMTACDVSTVQSKTCLLTTPYDISFDLTHISGVTINPPNTHYKYELYPCTKSGINSACGVSNSHTPIHVTQTDTTNSVCHSLGQGDGKLRYIDNTLTLTYIMGDVCHNSLARSSIISFICPKDVNKNCTDKCVSFVAEEHCIYNFEWITDLACGKPTGSKCKFTLNGVNYNLGLLTEDVTPTYAAVTISGDTACYLINPCGEVSTTKESWSGSQYCNQRKAPMSCQHNSVCKVLKTGNGIPLGSFNLNNAGTIHTVDNSVVSVSTVATGSGKSALIQYICQTGTLLTSPVFVSQFTSNITEFHWYTFAACPQGVVFGSDCIVTEPATGFKFNLTSLSKQSFEFNDTKKNFQYTIRVCSAIPLNKYGGSCANNSAICQHASGQTVNKSAGTPSSALIYRDSTLKLIYTNGDACHDKSKRQTTVVFLCDPNAHKASVENVTEIRHCEYLVEIRTKLACPPAYRSSECVYFSSNGDSYDLLELEKTEGNWQAEGADGSVYLINVCRPLNLQGIGRCNPLSAVCRVSGSTSQDLGYASTSSLHQPTISSTNKHVDLVLTYSYKLSGDNNGQCSTVYTDIEFVCNTTAPIGNGPQHVSGGDLANPCHHIFRWLTRVACPIRNEITKECKITDTTTGYTFNIDQLKSHQSIYNIHDTAGNTHYTLALCGALQASDSRCSSDKGDIAVCQVDSLNHTHNSGVYSNMTLTYVQESLKLIYYDGQSCSHGDHRMTEIDFVCDRKFGDNFYGAPVFDSESSHCHYLFIWHTPLACLPTKIECIAGGSAYDLRPLMQTRNWYVNTDHGRFVLGVCQPISSDQSCTDKSGVGACLVTPGSGTNNGTVYGYMTGDLVVVGNGQVQLTYHNGESCSGGFRKVTIINFLCNSKADPGQPVLVSFTNPCRAEFTWETIYACSQNGISSSWIIANNRTGQVYNLTQLTLSLSGNETNTKTKTKYRYTLGLGGHNVPCGNRTDKNIAICQKSLGNNRTFVLARTNGGSLKIIDGKVQMIHENGDNCTHTNKPRKSVIFFEYDPRPDSLEIFPEEECEYTFVVYTRLVYEKSQNIGVQCSLPNFPDLGWFTTVFTWPIIVGPVRIYFSVCKPISSDNQYSTKGFTKCSTVAGACLINGSSVLNLGRPSSYHPPVLATGGNGVIITYTGGDHCSNGKTYTTKIMLTCSNTTGSSQPSLTNPVFDDLSHPILRTNTCEFVILWPSIHACPFPIPSTKILDVGCTIQDPFDGTKFNLTSLSNNTHVMDKSGQYIIGLCGPISKAPNECHNGKIGVCHYSGTQWTPLAYTGHQITVVSHSPHTLDIVYPSGSSCSSGGTWSVIIRMYCSVRNSSSHPHWVSTTGCEIHFDWPTSILCVGQSEGCFATGSDNTLYDLEPLVSQTWQGDYVYGNSKSLGVFNISICRNLNPTTDEGTHCFPGPAGICLQPEVFKKSFLNLGYMTKGPTVTSSGIITLQYTGGSGCGSGNISTTVNLHCSSTMSQGSIHLTKADNCHYTIDWSTSVACKHTEKTTTSCVLEDTKSGIQYNFKSLAKNLPFTDLVHKDVTYQVCLCPGGSCTNGAQIIRDNKTLSSKPIKTNLGKFHQMVVFPNTGPQVSFQGGDTCTDGNKYSSTVFMRCDRSTSQERGKFEFEQDLSTVECQKFFSWWTPLACPTSEVTCSIENPSNSFFYNFYPLHPTNGYWTVSQGDKTYYINICGAIHEGNKTTCAGNAAVCMRNGDGSYTDLGYSYTQSIVINSNHNPEIHFHGPRVDSTSPPTKVVIEMICGIKGLQYSSSTNHNYQFQWYNTFVCPDTSNLHSQSDCSKFIETGNAYTFYPTKINSHMTVSSGTGDGMFHINLCGHAQQCSSNVRICLNENGRQSLDFGSTAFLIVIDSFWMQVSMAGKDGNSTITIECVQDNENNQEVSNYLLEKMMLVNDFTSQSGRRVYFKMYTKQGCSFNSNNVPGGTTPPPPPSSHSTTIPIQKSGGNRALAAVVVTICVVLIIVIIIVVIVLWKKERRDYLSKSLFSLMGSKSNETVRYVRTKTTEIDANLLDETSSNESDEDPFQETHLGAENLLKQTKTSKQTEKSPLIDLISEENEHISDEELLNL